MKKIILTAGVMAVGANLSAFANTQKPNIVWFLIEDTSPEYLAMFNEGKGAKTPNLEKLKDNGVIFSQAFSNAPVSSAARTSLITGCFAPRIAGSFHRHIEKISMPEGYKMFPSYLKQEGYYTSNANKTDYNVETDPNAWDNIKSGEAGWRKRPDKSQPFFYMYSTNLTHESKLLFQEDIVKSVKPQSLDGDVFIAPYHPTTDLMRYTYATFYDQIAKADAKFGELINQLTEDNEMDNTIIFFFGDNGGCVPGTKGYTDNIGLHVPLLVYIPPALQGKYNLPIGGVDNRTVSFIDFGATALNIAGIKVPKTMDGMPFIDKKRRNEPTVVGYGDRFDDLYAHNRVIYADGFRYARNYQPYHTQGLHAYYRYKSLAFQQWRKMFYENKLNDAQSSFFESFGTEELYDLNNDPHELDNLAHNPKYKKRLIAMRKQLHNYLINKRDLGFIPESVTLAEVGTGDIVKYGERRAKDIARYAQIADLQLEDYSSAIKKLDSYIHSTDNIDKWWAITTLLSFTEEPKVLIQSIKTIFSKENPSYLRARALVYLSLAGEKFDKSQFVEVLINSTSLAEVILVLNDFAFLKEQGVYPQIKLNNEQLPYNSVSTAERIKFLNNNLL